MQKLFEESKSLLYSELRCFGIYALPVGFAAETGGVSHRTSVAANGGSFATKCAIVYNGLLDSREELICCSAFFQCELKYGFPIALC